MSAQQMMFYIVGNVGFIGFVASMATLYAGLSPSPFISLQLLFLGGLSGYIGLSSLLMGLMAHKIKTTKFWGVLIFLTGLVSSIIGIGLIGQDNLTLFIVGLSLFASIYNLLGGLILFLYGLNGKLISSMKAVETSAFMLLTVGGLSYCTSGLFMILYPNSTLLFPGALWSVGAACQIGGLLKLDTVNEKVKSLRRRNLVMGGIMGVVGASLLIFTGNVNFTIIVGSLGIACLWGAFISNRE